MKVLVHILIYVCLHKYADGGLAPFITACRSSDAACLVSAAQAAVPAVAAGVPALGISVLDPLPIRRVTASQAGLDLDFRNTIVKGLRNCQVLDLKRKVHKTFVELRCSVLMTGDYSLGGRLLLLPIEGEGRYKIKIRDIVVKLVYDIEDRQEGGETYWRVRSWRHSAEVQTGVQFLFQNLFNGNKQLSDVIHEVANERWQDIFEEVAPPIVTAIVEQIVEQTTKIFDQVPVRELQLP